MDTPVGTDCGLCGESIKIDDEGAFYTSGEPVHRECFLRSTVGGAGHWLDHAFWCVGVGDPDGGMSYRESAKWVDRALEEGRIRL